MSDKIHITVSTLLEMKFRDPPKKIKDVIYAMEIIKDHYYGLIENKEVIFLFYILSGFTCKYLKKLGEFHVYRAQISGTFTVKLSNINPRFPLTYDFNGEGLGLLPNFLVSFNMIAQESSVSPISLVMYIQSNAPSKYKNRENLKLSIFKNYPIDVTISRGLLTLGKSS